MITSHNNSVPSALYKLPIFTLENTPTSIVYEIPAGRPDPTQPCGLNEDNRDRIRQSAQTGNTCFDSTMNFLKRRIGRFPAKGLEKESKIEKICSLRKKALIKHEESLKDVVELLSRDGISKFLNPIDLNTARSFINNKEKIQVNAEKSCVTKLASSMWPLLEEYIKEGKCKNMYEFLIQKFFDPLNRINEDFLSKFNLDAEKLFEDEMAQKNKAGEKSFKNLNLFKKVRMLDFFMRDASAEAYGLKKSSWAPIHGVDGLISELKEKGPLLVGGEIGKPAYQDEPFKMKRGIADREIYAWKPNAKRTDRSFSAHIILLVGAQKIDDKGYAYFIDPTDPSDPKDRSMQKIYMISFNNLISNISDLKGVISKGSPFPYAYYGNFKL